MKVLSSHLTGNANVKAALYGLIEAGLLEEFYVTIASIPGGFLDKLGAIGFFSEIRRRRFDPMIKPFIHTWPWLEAGRVLVNGKFKALSTGTKAPFQIDNVIQNLDRHVARRLRSAQKKGVNAIYSYEDMAVFTFREAKHLGIECLYDLPIGYWRTAHRLLEVEKKKRPEWGSTMHGLGDPEAKLANKDEELKLADRIFVASTFTANSLRDFPGKLAPIEIIPYGFPAINNEIRQYSSFHGKRPLRLLFVGSLSQRKGIADLFEAVESFGNRVTLTIVGRKTTGDCAALDAAIPKHTWINSMPHHEILEQMRQHDVFVFPSLFEGFGLVITEAMSQGTPVITTDRTAGPDIIEHGEEGWLINAGSTIALKEIIERILQKPDLIKKTGRAAMEKARKRPWEVYGAELALALSKK